MGIIIVVGIGRRARDVARDIARARRVASEERGPSFVMDARFGRVWDADVERRRDAHHHHHHHNRLLRHRASTSRSRRARDGREWGARTRWLARFVAACACVWLVSGSGSRRGGEGRATDGGGGASRRELASGRPRATTTVGGMRRESERAAVETATRAEAELEALKREHDGLGRYGDPVDANGDLKAMEKMRDIVRPGGFLLLAVPVGADLIKWNAHRKYGRARLPVLLHHWSLVAQVAPARGDEGGR